MQRVFMNTLTAKALARTGEVTYADGVYTMKDGRVALIDDWLDPGQAHDETSTEGSIAAQRAIDRARITAVQAEFASLMQSERAA